MSKISTVNKVHKGMSYKESDNDENSKISESPVNRNNIISNKSLRKKKKKCVDFIDYIKQNGMNFKFQYENGDSEKFNETPLIKAQRENSKIQEHIPLQKRVIKNVNVNITEFSDDIIKNNSINEKNEPNFNNYKYVIKKEKIFNRIYTQYANYLRQFNLKRYMLYSIFLQYQNEQLKMYHDTYHSMMIHNGSKDQKEPEKPYFFHSHKEEEDTINVLCILEALFTFDNLDQDFILRKMLNDEGFVSLEILAEHPQMKIFGMNADVLMKVLIEHRQNEITETVETFDGINIRNRDWVDINEQLTPLNEVFDRTMVKMTLFHKKLQNYLPYYFNYENYQKNNNLSPCNI